MDGFVVVVVVLVVVVVVVVVDTKSRCNEDNSHTKPQVMVDCAGDSQHGAEMNSFTSRLTK